jgi:ubiquinone/menaquinone biosynthesis C-methylase UbiE
MQWYEESFGKDYLTVYKHRDHHGALEEVKRISSWLKLPKGAEVLDLCCGMGRHSLALHELGYKVTGLDLSDVLLTEARKTDVRSGIQWVKGDMRRLLFTQPFDAVFNLFTSFGYFVEDGENMAVLKEIHKYLKPGGKFVIDFLNPDYVISRLIPYSERVEEDTTIRENRNIVEDLVVKRIAIAEKNQPIRHYREQVKLYRLTDFENMFTKAGLTMDTSYGDYFGNPFERYTSSRLIMLGHKKVK